MRSFSDYRENREAENLYYKVLRLAEVHGDNLYEVLLENALDGVELEELLLEARPSGMSEKDAAALVGPGPNEFVRSRIAPGPKGDPTTGQWGDTTGYNVPQGHGDRWMKGVKSRIPATDVREPALPGEGPITPDDRGGHKGAPRNVGFGDRLQQNVGDQEEDVRKQQQAQIKMASDAHNGQIKKFRAYIANVIERMDKIIKTGIQKGKGHPAAVEALTHMRGALKKVMNFKPAFDYSKWKQRIQQKGGQIEKAQPMSQQNYGSRRQAAQAQNTARAAKSAASLEDKVSSGGVEGLGGPRMQDVPATPSVPKKPGFMSRMFGRGR